MPDRRPGTESSSGKVRQPHGPSRRRSQARREVFRDLVEIAAEQGAPITLNVSTATALQEVLDRGVALWRFAAQNLDRVVLEIPDAEDLQPGDDPAERFFEEMPGPGGSVVVVPNRWYTLEKEARADVERLAGMMTQLGIAERHVRVEEARAALVVAAIRDAAIEIGLTNEQISALGARLRDNLDQAHEPNPESPAKKSSFSQSQSADTSRQVAKLGPGH